MSKHLFAAVVILLVALGNVVAAPLISNQNTYLLSVVGDPSDWLAAQTDPFRVFAAVARALHDVGGVTAWRIAAYLLTVAAVWGVYLVARALVAGEAVPLVATVLVGLTLVPVAQGSGQEYLSAFHGLAGQYLIWKPGYLQPSAAGCLVLLAVGLWWCARPGVAAALVIIAGSLHPTYVVVVAIGLAAALLADLVTGGGWRRLPAYVGTVLVGAGVSLMMNPGFGDLAGGGDALTRFAFERIPHHTLWTQWRGHDLVLLGVILAGILLARPLRRGVWLRVWLTAALAPGLLAAVIVEWTRWTPLALLFPWRITAVLVPVAATVIAVRAAMLLARLPVRHWRVPVLATAAVAAVWGTLGSARQLSPSQSDPAVRAVLAGRPVGTGLVPLAAENVRANAAVVVYVDWKSPPYAGDALPLWWRRYDQVAAFERDPASICGAAWEADIDWALLTVPPPTCMVDWQVIADQDGYLVVQR